MARTSRRPRVQNSQAHAFHALAKSSSLGPSPSRRPGSQNDVFIHVHTCTYHARTRTKETAATGIVVAKVGTYRYIHATRIPRWLIQGNLILRSKADMDAGRHGPYSAEHMRQGAITSTVPAFKRQAEQRQKSCFSPSLALNLASRRCVRRRNCHARHLQPEARHVNSKGFRAHIAAKFRQCNFRPLAASRVVRHTQMERPTSYTPSWM